MGETPPVYLWPAENIPNIIPIYPQKNMLQPLIHISIKQHHITVEYREIPQKGRVEYCQLESTEVEN